MVLWRTRTPQERREMKHGKVINSPAADLPRNAKKAEGKKRKSPCTPYREKGKGKETRRGSCGTVCRARARGLRARLMDELDRDLDRLAAAYHPTPDDRSQWASIALRVGVENFHFAVEDKFKEDAADGTNFSRPPAVFQAFLNRRFPKEGGAR